jgi:hypothetical protein
MMKAHVLKLAQQTPGNKRKGIPFSRQRLFKIRRLRKARRLWRREPLFAYARLQQIYPNYTEMDFIDDLRRRKPKKKRFAKKFQSRYGRYDKIQSLLKEFDQTQDFKYVLLANKLKARIAKPYIIRVKKGKKIMEYSAPPETSYAQIERFVLQAHECPTFEQANALFGELLRCLKG